METNKTAIQIDVPQKEKRKKQKMSEKRKNDVVFVYLIFAWPLIHFLIFGVGMNFSMIINSFCKENISGELFFVGLDNYKTVFGRMFGLFGMEADGIIGPKAWWNSLSVGLIAIFINTPLTVLFSYMIYKKVFGHRFFQIVLFVPAIMSSVVLCLAYKLMVDTQFGIVPELMKMLGLGKYVPYSGGLLGSEDTIWSTISIFNVWMGVSGYLIYYNSAMARLPGEVIESAQIDGASEVRQFFSIVLPLIWPVVTTMTITLVSSMFTWFMPSLLLTGGNNYSATTIGLIITTMTKNGTSAGFVPALGIVVGIIGSIIMFGIRRIMESFWHDVEY